MRDSSVKCLYGTYIVVNMEIKQINNFKFCFLFAFFSHNLLQVWVVVIFFLWQECLSQSKVEVPICV